MDYQALCRRFDSLKADRGTFESHWQEVAEYIFPRRADFNTERTAGDKRNNKILDSTGMRGLGLLAAGLHGFVSNPASRWFSLKTTDDDLNKNDAVREWLGKVEDIIYAQMHSPQSSITTHLDEMYLDYAAFGTAIMFIGETKDGESILFQTRFLGECVIDENSEGVVDTLFRCFKMTVRQVMQMEQWDPSEDTRKKFSDDKLDDKVVILHAVMPRTDRDKDKITPDNMPFASIYIEKGAKHKLKEDGFEEFPYAVPRWYKVAGEKYGRSPAMDALPDVKMLQEMKKTTIKAAQKIVDPPLMVPDESQFSPVRTVPGGLNFYRDEKRIIVPLQTGANIPISLEMMQDLRDQILKTFYADIMQPAIEKQLTAYEYSKIIEQAMRLLGPVMGRMTAELLGVIITRVFGIMARKEMLPPQPPELDGKPFRVEYISPMALAQRAAKVDTVMNALAMAGQVAAAVDSGSPTLARFNGEDFLQWLFDRVGADPELILDDEEYAAKQKQTQMANMIPPAAMAADAFAKAGQGAKAFAEAGQVGRA